MGFAGRHVSYFADDRLVGRLIPCRAGCARFLDVSTAFLLTISLLLTPRQSNFEILAATSQQFALWNFQQEVAGSAHVVRD